MVNKVGGGKGFGPIDSIKKQTRTEPKKEAGKASAGDRVDFSNLLQSASQTQEVSAPQTSARAEKLQTLKNQIASGQYRPDLEKVAARMMKFIVEDQV